MMLFVLNSSKYFNSFSISSSVLHTKRLAFSLSATLDIPLITSPKKGLDISGITTPMMLVFLLDIELRNILSLLASSSNAFKTKSLVSSLT